MNTFPVDAYYGHSSILAWYCGLRAPRPIFGQTQHGWYNGHRTISEGGAWSTRFPLAFGPKLVWSKADEVEVRELYQRVGAGGPVTAVAAPFVYLVDLLGGREALAARGRERHGTLAFPVHTIPGMPPVKGHGVFAESLSRLAEPPITVSLFVVDYHNPAVRSVYERPGFSVTTNGQRRDPLFLVKLTQSVLSHRRSVGNGVGSALLYSAYLGADVEVWSDGASAASAANRGGLVDGRLAGDAALAWGDRHLGHDSKLPPDALRQALGWSGWRRTAAFGAASALALRRRLVAGYWDVERDVVQT